MSLVDLPTAKLHLRVDGAAEDAILPLYIGAAEQSAMEFLNRKVYLDQDALTVAIAALPAALVAARAAYDAALAAALLLESAAEQAATTQAALSAYQAAQTLASETRLGMVVNDAVKAAVLLLLGHLFANREEVVTGVTVTALPMGARSLLQPYRVGMGI